MTTKEPRTKRMIVKLSEKEWRAYRKMADGEKLDLSEWVRARLNTAVEERKNL